jgi:hypothetical protein
LYDKLFRIKEVDSKADQEEDAPGQDRGRIEPMARRDVGEAAAVPREDDSALKHSTTKFRAVPDGAIGTKAFCCVARPVGQS